MTGSNETTTTTTLSRTAKAKKKSTKPHPHSDESNRPAVIGSIIGVLFILVLIVLGCIYLYTKRKGPFRRKYSHRKKDKWKNNFDFEQTETRYVETPRTSRLGYENEALQKSNQDIERGNPGVHVETNALVSHERSDRSPYNISSHDFSIDKYDVCIKLLTPWCDVYNRVSSPEYSKMKECVEQSIDNIYMDLEDYRGSNVLRFREGSLICHLRLEFYKGAVEPLSLIEHAVADGSFTSIEVDRTYFKLNDYNEENLQEEQVPLAMSALSDSVGKEFKRRSGSLPSKVNRIESGYGSQYFDPNKVIAQLSRDHKKRENSQKSFISVDSVISDTSPKSLSSTNVSIHDQAELEIEKLERSNPLKNIFRSLGKSDSKKLKKKFDPNGPGVPHVAVFDFAPQDFRELSLKSGEMVNAVCVSDGGWVKVVNKKGAKGWVPQNFIVQMNQDELETTRKAVESILYFNQVIDSIDTELDDQPIRTPPSHHEHLSNNDDNGSHGNEDEDEYDSDYEILKKEGNEDVTNLFITMFPHEPTEKKELQIDIGDLIDVIQTSETGWWKGVCLRTQEGGWFPSSYVKPHSAEVDFTEFLGDGDDISKEALSDNDEQTKKSSFKVKVSNDTRSDDGIDLTQVQDTENSEVQEMPTVRRKLSDDNSVYWNNKLSKVSDDSEFDYRKGFRPLSDISKDISKSENHIYHECEVPSKPVPPKPRKRHIQEAVRHLAAEGKLGSTESLTTRSNENLALYLNFKRNRQIRRGSLGHDVDETSAQRGFVLKDGVTRARPKSHQDKPKSSFIHLANLYAANSLPALNTGKNDQIKLSPDDERPYLEPIPRKSKRTKEKNVNEELTDNNEDITKVPKINSNQVNKLVDERFANKPLPSTPVINKSKSRHKKIVEKPNIPKRISGKKHNTKKFIEDQLRLNSEKTARGRGNIGEHMLPHRTSNNASSRVRGNHRPFARCESTIFEETESANSPIDEKALFTRSQEDLRISSTGDSTNTKKSSGNSNDSPAHIRYHSEPYTGDISDTSEKNLSDNDKNVYREPSHDKTSGVQFARINSSEEMTKKEYIENNTDILSQNSRTSSIQSLTSIASSTRSSASSRPEQMNLRRAVVNVYGQGVNDLTFKVGSMLYELRPRNKDGLCFGLLEDSTQGWYPAEAVEPYS